MSFPFRHSNGNICCSSPSTMCPTCAGKVAAARMAGEVVPPEILRAAKAAMQAHLNGGRITEADMLALESGIRAAADAAAPSGTPDSYEPHLSKIREANATPMSKFEDRYRAERQAELTAEYARQKENR